MNASQLSTDVEQDERSPWLSWQELWPSPINDGARPSTGCVRAGNGALAAWSLLRAKWISARSLMLTLRVISCGNIFI